MYLKVTLPHGEALTAELTDKNIFTRCAECGRELPVSLGALSRAGIKDPLNADVLCDDCFEGDDHGTLDITMDALLLLARTLMRSGYQDALLTLYEKYSVSALQELDPDDYQAFADDLEALFRKGEDV